MVRCSVTWQAGIVGEYWSLIPSFLSPSAFGNPGCPYGYDLVRLIVNSYDISKMATLLVSHKN